MIEEGRELSKLHKNIVIKIPMCEEGLKAVSVLSKEGIKTKCNPNIFINAGLISS